MKIEKITQLKVELEETERIILDDAILVLKRIYEAMEHHDCDTVMCDDVAYDISDVRAMINDLKRFKDISEFFY